MESLSFKVSRSFRRQTAFTLVELLATLVILAIVSAMALTTMSNLLLRKKMETNVNRLIADLALTRSEAIKRGTAVTLCQSSDGTSCTGQGYWHTGYIVFADTDDDHTVDTGEEIIRKQAAVDGLIKYTALQKHYIRYLPSGAAFPNGSFIFCDARGSSAAKSLIVYRTGRARTASKTSEGGSLVCPTS